MQITTRLRAIAGAACLLAAPIAGSMHGAQAQTAQAPITYSVPAAVILPLIVGWYNGEPAPYLATEASDLTVARLYRANYVPRLANAANTMAVDDIYGLTNYEQGNVIPSAPMPAGPHNRNPNYTPLWQLTMVTWVNPHGAFLLTSEAEILRAAAAGMVTLNKTDIVINCSVIFTPQGGLLPRATLLQHYRK